MTDYEGPRSIEEHELQDLIDMLNAVFRPDGGDMGKEYPRHVSLCNQENVRIIKDGGKIVSHVATSVRPVCLGGIQTWEAGIGAVATLPEGRGKGYASILMQDAVRRSVAQGADIMLISGDLGVYRRMHAVDCGQYPVVEIGKDIPTGNTAFLCSRTTAEDIESIYKLWETLPTRYILPLEDWRALFECKHVMDKPSDWWTVRLDDVIVGFGIVHQKDSVLQLFEWAGHPDALNAASAYWFQNYPVNSMTYIPSSINLLPLAWKQYISRVRGFDGTVLVINASRFLQRALACFIERIGEDPFLQLEIDAKEQSICFGFEGESCEFENGGELALLFFGHPTEDILSTKLTSGSKLHSILRRMFPVPLVWYGVGYV